MVAVINHAPAPSSYSAHSDFNLKKKKKTECLHAKCSLLLKQPSFGLKEEFRKLRKEEMFPGPLCSICTRMSD